MSHYGHMSVYTSSHNSRVCTCTCSINQMYLNKSTKKQTSR